MFSLAPFSETRLNNIFIGRAQKKRVKEPRDYQKAIAASVLSRGNTLVVLPTGLGKTLIALLVIVERMKHGRVLFLAPTKPLCEQHFNTIRDELGLGEGTTALISGEVQPRKRQELWAKRIAVSTPQTARNDIMAGRLKIDHSLCVIDEAHRAVGNYAYTFVASECAKAGTLVLGLTASPGANRKKIENITSALSITNVEARSHDDLDVSEYVKPMQIIRVPVQLGPGMTEARDLLGQMIKENAGALEKLGFRGYMRSKKALLQLKAKILADQSPRRYAALSYFSTLFDLMHLQELLETQGVGTFLKYLEKVKLKQTKAASRIIHDRRLAKITLLAQSSGEHPKLERAVQIAKSKSEAGEKLIVFSQYRDQIARIVEALKRAGVRAERFIGKREGVTRREQEETIARFRNGEFDVMVASSIGEEGLDIPSVDTVVFFEPIPSEIRNIQRRGRAGRAKAGKVVLLVTSDTRDEAFYWVARKREATMKRIVEGMRLGSHAKSSAAGSLFTPGAKESEKIASSIVKEEATPAPVKKEEAIAESVHAKPYFAREKGKRKRRRTEAPQSSSQKNLGDFF
jgi:Fanconi anemia group M protein